MRDQDIVLALDFGGTKLSAAVVSAVSADSGLRAWSDLRREYTPAAADAAYEQEAMLALARAVLGEHRPAAIGVSFGGPVDHTAGRVRLSHHVTGWEDTPLAALLSEALGAPAVVDNDATIAAVGEHRFGTGHGYASLLYVTVSTGVGGGWILDGRPWRGQDGMAGEIGHVVVDPAGPVCLCGKRGCVERLASGPYMAVDAAEWLRQHPEDGPMLGQMAVTAGAITGQQVAEAAAAGDSVARAFLLRGARALGTGLGNSANLVNPQRFILGGGVTKSGPLWWDAVRQTARATALPEVQFDVVPAALGDDAPLWGAVALALDVLLPQS